ncbi:hsdR [Salmonella enterica subsp. salamae]|nr:hsdR [Salmonella enterica subsp. salamae]
MFDHNLNVDSAAPQLSEDVKALINNGLSFLEQAQKELDDSKPQFSLVSFWTAVELFLKVPLAHEHWSLICSRKTPPKKKSYQEGDFVSISYDETRALLRDVLEKPLSDDTHIIFDKVRKHRNRLVHFYHSDFTDKQSKQILEEQADAWFRLYQLIRKDWRPIIGEALYLKLTLDEGRLLRTSLFYSKAKFRALAPKLKELRDKGHTIVKCYTCSNKAGVQTPFNEDGDNVLYETDCLVCGYVTDRSIDVLCPGCGCRQRIEADGELNFTCEKCQHSESKHDLLDESTSSDEDVMYSGGIASCSDCGGYETICDFGGSYLCVNCFALHDTVGQCEYCGASSTKIPDMSSLFGCEFCSGNENIIYDDD